MFWSPAKDRVSLWDSCNIVQLILEMFYQEEKKHWEGIVNRQANASTSVCHCVIFSAGTVSKRFPLADFVDFEYLKHPEKNGNFFYSTLSSFRN